MSQTSYDKTREWLIRELCKAFYEARRHKRRTNDEFKFEINWEKNILQLADDILDDRYDISRSIAFIIRRPVAREIFAAPFRDRVVHHFLYNMSAEWWDNRLIYDSYSCRKKKGTLFGIQRLQHHIRSVSQNGTKKAWVIKLDIQGYFMSLPRDLLYERMKWGLSQQFASQTEKRDFLVRIWRKVIFDNPCSGAKRRGKFSDWDILPPEKSLFNQLPGIGIVIGNLSSQLLSNIYLDQLDRFVKLELGYKHYGRYVDDFYIVVPDNDYLRALADIERIKEFLRKLGLTLHPKKRYIQPVSRGVEFLGAMIYPGCKVPGRRLRRNFNSAVYQLGQGKKKQDTLISYLGHMEHIDSRTYVEKVRRRYDL